MLCLTSARAGGVPHLKTYKFYSIIKFSLTSTFFLPSFYLAGSSATLFQCEITSKTDFDLLSN